MLLQVRIHQRSESSLPLKSLGSDFTQHEGNRHSYFQEGTGVIEEGFHEQQVKFVFTFAEIPELVGEKLLQKVDKIADDMAQQISKAAFQKIDETLEKAGQKLEGAGEPFSQDLYLRMFEKVDMTFDDSGRPGGVMVVHPDTGEWLAKRLREWEQDKDFMRRYNELMERKREAWRDRESNRKLVD